MRTRVFWLVLMLAAFAPATALRAQISDADLIDRIIDTVQRYPRFTIFDDISITVNNRAVRLTGWVTAPLKRDEIGQRVGKIDGIRTLTNDIKVLSVSRYDDDLRQRIAQAIYGHPTFWHYASMANPPIHIIVDGGRVILTGRVNSQVERQLAYALAQVPGSFEVKNEIKLDKER